MGEIANSKGKLVHRILVGPPAPESANWLTRCGWAFGGSRFARFPQAGDARCVKCFGGA